MEAISGALQQSDYALNVDASNVNWVEFWVTPAAFAEQGLD